MYETFHRTNPKRHVEFTLITTYFDLYSICARVILLFDGFYAQSAFDRLHYFFDNMDV